MVLVLDMYEQSDAHLGDSSMGRAPRLAHRCPLLSRLRDWLARVVSQQRHVYVAPHANRATLARMPVRSAFYFYFWFSSHGG